MSGIINKVKEAVIGGGHSKDHSEHTSGPHNTDTENRLDPRIDSDNSKHHGGLGNTSTTGGTYGSTGVHGAAAGPHENNAANILDPRVDSDRDGSRTVGNTTHGTTGHHGTSTHGTTGYGSSGTGGYGGSNAGPHDSNVANKLDPRVDSDREGSRTAGGNTGYGSTGYGHQGTTGGIHSDTAGTYGGPTTTPHSSGIANKLDPRIDTSGSGAEHHHGHATGFGQPGSEFGTTPGTVGRFDEYTSTGAHSGSAGHHQHQPNHPVGGTGITGSGAGYDNTSGYGQTSHTGTTGHGSGNTTAPHSSNLLNKLDPRVDSDRDGSKTVGNNNQTGTGPYA